MLWLPFTRAMNMPNRLLTHAEFDESIKRTVALVNSPTPRTDAVIHAGCHQSAERAMSALQEHAQKLERENTILRQVAKQAVDVVEPILRGL